jgi:replicative DNA helicase
MYENSSILRQSGLEFQTVEYQSLWDYVDRFSREHHHVPDIITLKNHFEKIDKNFDVSNQIEVIKTIKPVYKGDFKKRLEGKVEEQRIRKLEMILKEGNEINYNGMEVRDGKIKEILKGPFDAIKYVIRKSEDINRQISGLRKSGETISVEDVKEFSEDYDMRRDDPLFGKGYECGIDQMDESLGGLKNKQLWTHAAFTGQLKSTLAMNWVYHQAVYNKENSVFFSLEMPYEQCKRIIYIMHSMHEKFNDIRMELGIQENKDSPIGLEYKKVRDGQLSKEEEIFLKEHVLSDLANLDNNYGKIMIKCRDKMNYNVNDIKLDAEILYRSNPFKMIVIDHVLLVDSINRHPNTTERSNEIVMNLKKMTEIFNNGDGTAILALFQISREGVKRADKSNGMYSLYDLSYSNEIERSSDVVTTTYLNPELKQASRAQFQCLKSRDDEGFKPFYARIEWSCRRLITCLDEFEAGSVQEEYPGGKINLETVF